MSCACVYREMTVDERARFFRSWHEVSDEVPEFDVRGVSVLSLVCVKCSYGVVYNVSGYIGAIYVGTDVGASDRSVPGLDS